MSLDVFPMSAKLLDRFNKHLVLQFLVSAAYGGQRLPRRVLDRNSPLLRAIHYDPNPDRAIAAIVLHILSFVSKASFTRLAETNGLHFVTLQHSLPMSIWKC